MKYIKTDMRTKLEIENDFRDAFSIKESRMYKKF